MATAKQAVPSDIASGTIRKMRNRLIPLLFLLYIIAFLDRTNIGFAALTMNADLAITSTQFGLLTGAEPSSAFQILRARDRASLAINPFQTDTHPSGQTGVAMITSADEAIAAHQRVAESTKLAE